nr:phosphoribosyltransferase family protein [Acidianus manzaensis]
MLDSSKDKELRTRLLAVEILRELKNIYTYKQLSELFGIQESLLCRYVNGNTIPSDVQSLEILNKTKNKMFLDNLFNKKIKIYEDSYVDLSEMLLYPNLLKMLLEIYLNKIQGIENVTKVYSIASNGIPFATMISLILNKPLLIAKKHKDSIFLEYYEESIKETDSVVNNIYLRKDLLKKNDKVLIVDDVIKSGKTIASSLNLIRKANANVIGAFVIAGNFNNIKYIDNLDIYIVFEI